MSGIVGKEGEMTWLVLEKNYKSNFSNFDSGGSSSGSTSSTFNFWLLRFYCLLFYNGWTL